MALTLDASSPAQATGNTSGLATASFTAPASALLVAFVTYNNSTAGAANDHTVTDSGGLTWTLNGRKSPNAASTGGAGTAGGVEIWSATTSSSVARTVSAAFSGGTSRDTQVAVKVFTDTGGAPTIGAVAAAFSASGLPSVAVVTTAANSWVWADSSDWAQKGLGTAGTGQTITDEYNPSGQYTGHVWKQNATTTSSGTSVTMNLTAISGEQYNQLGVEILANSGGATNFNGAAASTLTLTSAAAGVVGDTTGATSTLTLTTVSVGAAGVAQGAASTVTLTGAGVGATGVSQGLASTLTLTSAAAGVVGESTGVASTITLTTATVGATGVFTGATSTLTLTTAAAGTATSGLSGTASSTITLTGAAAGNMARSSGTASALTLTGAAAGVVGESTGTATTVTLTSTAAGAVGRITGIASTVTLTGVAAGTVFSGVTGTATTTITLTATAAGVVGARGAVASVLQLVSAASPVPAAVLPISVVGSTAPLITVAGSTTPRVNVTGAAVALVTVSGS